MDRILVLSKAVLGGKATIYQRPGSTAFDITGIPKFLAHLEDPSRGQFYSISYRVSDFDTATLSASVRAAFTGAPASAGWIVFDGVQYTSQAILDNAIPNQFFRGGNALAAAQALAAAINATDGYAGSSYSGATVAHPTCSATYAATSDGAVVVVSYKTPGIIGDSIAAEDHMSYVSLDSKQFYGGLPLVNDLVTIDKVLYRVSDVPEPDTAGAIQIRLEKKAF